jgi:hypothetical protein
VSPARCEPSTSLIQVYTARQHVMFSFALLHVLQVYTRSAGYLLQINMTLIIIDTDVQSTERSHSRTNKRHSSLHLRHLMKPQVQEHCHANWDLTPTNICVYTFLNVGNLVLLTNYIFWTRIKIIIKNVMTYTIKYIGSMEHNISLTSFVLVRHTN